MKSARIWFLVADGSRARILRDLSEDEHSEDIVVEIDHRAGKEIMADRPGRSFSSVGARRSGMEYRTDPVRVEERAFAARIVDILETRRQAADFDGLVLIAPARMLGDIRAALPPGLGALLKAEVTKDLTKLPQHKLHDALRQIKIPRSPLNV